MTYNLGQYVSYGCGRVVFKLLDQDAVVKIPYNNRGIRQNQQEYDRFRAHETPYFADILNFDPNTGILVMRFVDTSPAEFFEDYAHDRTHCALYDDGDTVAWPGCDARCVSCSFNTLMQMLPTNYEEILAVHPKDRPQVGCYPGTIQYVYYDYGDGGMVPGESTWCFADSFAELFRDYFENGGNPLGFYDYLVQEGLDTSGHDYVDPQKIVKKRNKTMRRLYCKQRYA